MTDCKDRFRDLTHARDAVLNDDLAALERTSERARIERYNELKRNEEEFRFEFLKDCPDFFTEAETDRIRSEFRLARLLIAASFYGEGDLPAALAGDFAESELQAVVDFDRYKAFDALDEEGIQRRIRRMDGEVYDLVEEYHSTQLADLDALLESPDVQRDVMERLVERYEDRFEKVRQGFYTYVETHGLEHVVETVEEAVRAVAESEREREAVAQQLRTEVDSLAESMPEGVGDRRGDLEARIQALERALEDDGSREDSTGDLDELRERTTALERDQADAIEALSDRIDRVAELQERLTDRIDQLERVREEARENAPESAREETTAVLDGELDALRDQRSDLERELDHLRRERAGLEAANDRLEERQSELERHVRDDDSPDADAVEGAVSGTLARLYEVDYVGRFDTSVRETDVLVTPDGEFEVPDGYWEHRSEHLSERVPVTAEYGDPDGDPTPINSRARYEVESTSYMGLSRDLEMVVEAEVYSHLDVYDRNGYDAAPADLDDLLSIVDEVVYAADDGDYHHLIGIASPTGWTDRVRDRIADDDGGRSWFSRNVSVCLVDLQDGSVLYDPADEVAAGNAHLYELSVDDQRVRECVEFVRREYVEAVEHDSVLLEDLVEDEGFDVHVVRRAFDRLAAEGAGERIDLDELGPALAVGDRQ